MKNRIATAADMYNLLIEVARTLDNTATPYPTAETIHLETEIRTRVAASILTILKDTGYPVVCKEIVVMGGVQRIYTLGLLQLLQSSRYGEFITAVQEILHREESQP